MKYLAQKRIANFAAGLALAALITTPTFPQIRAQLPPQPPGAQAEIRKPPVQGRVNTQTIEVNSKPSRRFIPFEMKDPKTGNPIPPDTRITLPNGKSMTAAEYFKELNKLEEAFNKIGYSLRDTQQEFVLQKSKVNPNLQRQAQRLVTAHKKSTANGLNQLIDPKFLENKFRNEIKSDSGRLQKLRASTLMNDPCATERARFTQLQNELSNLSVNIPPGKPENVYETAALRRENWMRRNGEEFNRLKQRLASPECQLGPTGGGSGGSGSSNHCEKMVKTWGDPLGDSGDSFSAYFNGRFELNGTPAATTINGESRAGGYIFGEGGDIVRVTGNLNAPVSGTMAAGLNVFVLGYSVYNVNQNTNEPWSKSDSVSKTFDWSKTIYFTLGPLPGSATFGAHGRAGISYWVGLRPVYAAANFAPEVHADVYGEGGIDLLIGGGGVGVSMTLLDDTLRIGVESSNKFDDPLRGPYCFKQVYIHNKLHALDGRVYAYAYVYEPCWDWPPICKKQWDWNIWDWSGISTEGDLLNETQICYYNLRVGGPPVAQ